MDMQLKNLPAADCQGGAIKLELISILTILSASVYAHISLSWNRGDPYEAYHTISVYIYIQWLYLWRTKQI